MLAVRYVMSTKMIRNFQSQQKVKDLKDYQLQSYLKDICIYIEAHRFFVSVNSRFSRYLFPNFNNNFTFLKQLIWWREGRTISGLFLFLLYRQKFTLTQPTFCL